MTDGFKEQYMNVNQEEEDNLGDLEKNSLLCRIRIFRPSHKADDDDDC